MPINALSVDVEELFHGEYTRKYKTADAEYRTPKNIVSILNLFEEYKVKATFFIVGEIAERYPNVIQLIRDDGHEIAFHGWSHLPLWKLNPDSFKIEVARFKHLCPECIGYRAPSFSLNNNTRWALEILKEEGFKYDSSVFPTWTPLYGAYRAPTRPYRPSFDNIMKEDFKVEFVEFPLLTYRFIGLKIPAAGGFWLRIFNINIIADAIRDANNSGVPASIFFHNWETDDQVPEFKMPKINHYITYHNHEKTKNKLVKLLKQYQFTSFSRCLLDYL